MVDSYDHEFAYKSVPAPILGLLSKSSDGCWAFRPSCVGWKSWSCISSLTLCSAPDYWWSRIGADGNVASSGACLGGGRTPVLLYFKAVGRLAVGLRGRPQYKPTTWFDPKSKPTGWLLFFHLGLAIGAV